MLRGLYITAEEPSQLHIVAGGTRSKPGDSWPRLMHLDKSEWNDPDFRAHFKVLLKFVETRLIARVYSAELVFLFLSTLQWGYGDLFHKWLNRTVFGS
jgi:hypothetical protein